MNSFKRGALYIHGLSISSHEIQRIWRESCYRFHRLGRMVAKVCKKYQKKKEQK